MNKKNITVVMGGPSEEHEISLKTGFEMIRHLDTEKYEIAALVIDREKRFYFAPEGVAVTSEALNNPSESDFFEGPFSPVNALPIWETCDFALLGLHGEFGEDGVFQGYLETIDIPYSGCSIFASALGMHKIAAKKLFEGSGIPTPPYAVYRQGDSIEMIAARHGFPCFVKAPQSGSSKLLGKADNFEQLELMLTEFIKEAKSVLVEAVIEGDEFSCPVLEINGEVKALPPVYIKPAEGHFFDYEAKYLGKSEEIVPAPFDDETIKLIQKAAVAVHITLECDTYSRTDVIMKEGIPYVLEVNTLPGFTAQSLFPQAYAASGGTFTQLLDKLIKSKLQYKE